MDMLEGDVKKEKTMSPGHQGWAAKAAYLEALLFIDLLLKEIVRRSRRSGTWPS